MVTTSNEQGLSRLDAPSLTRWASSFLLAKRAEGRSPATIKVYGRVLDTFTTFCSARSVTTIDAVDPGIIREYLLERSGRGCSPADTHKHYRTLRTWLRWYEAEDAPDGWRNPIKRVGSPQVPDKVLEAVPLAHVAQLLARAGVRDRAVLLVLIDTGLRASELCALDLADFDPAASLLIVRQGKGGRVRVVPLGAKARRALRQWIRARPADGRALFCSSAGDRLTYWGLRQVVRRLAGRAGISKPSLHSFRRAFTIEMLRAGVDLLSLSRLLGHADLSLLARYAKQSVDDLRRVKASASPGDRL